jgi:hypothetical protein
MLFHMKTNFFNLRFQDNHIANPSSDEEQHYLHAPPKYVDIAQDEWQQMIKDIDYCQQMRQSKGEIL